MRRLSFVVSLLICLIGFSAGLPVAQAQQDLIALSVNAGFGGHFRENLWFPLQITVTNNGDPISGRLVVRPERSAGLTNTYSTPISIGTNARQTVFLNATMRASGASIRVELIDDGGIILREVELPMRNLAPRDRLYIVISGGATAFVDLSQVSTAGQNAAQVSWQVTNIPDRPGALAAVNGIVLHDVDTGALTAAQRRALSAWVLSGGHLIVTGGAGWQQTAFGVAELLPFVPSGTVTVDDLSPVARFAGDFTSSLAAEVRLAAGAVTDAGRVLLALPDDTPLIARRAYGNGTVDYLTFDPLLEPVRDWASQPALWFTLIASADTRPVWANHTLEANLALNALSILPGETATPEALTMVGFLALYIFAIGPLNYLILSRINRLELAWLTIPTLIVIFTAISWTTGFNLRGSDAIVSRLSVVQSWAGTDTAYLTQYLGVIAPRRADYTLEMTDDRLLRPLIPTDPTGLVSSGGVGNVLIEDGTRQRAVDFAVDASFVAGFQAMGVVPALAVGGRVALSFGVEGQITARGSVRNDSPQALSDPVVLLPDGQMIVLDEGLPPGSIVPFDAVFSQSGQLASAPLPANLEYPTGLGFIPAVGRTIVRRDFPIYQRTVTQLLGNREPGVQAFGNPPLPNEAERQESLRRAYFLASQIADQPNAQNRGSRAYLVAWGDAAPVGQTLVGAPSRTVDTTLYVVELELEIVSSPGEFTVPASQFNWVALRREGLSIATPTDIDTFSDIALEFRFTPFADYVMDEVTALDLYIERRTSLRDTRVSLWNWSRQAWEEVLIDPDQLVVTIRNPRRFLGAQNAVQVQIIRQGSPGQLILTRLAVEQRGRLRSS